MADVTERMLRLLATLQAGRSFGGEELSARLGVSPRTLRRDVERLRGYGYPVRTRPGPGGTYQLTAGKQMPPLVLDDDEAVAVVAGLAALAGATSAEPGGLHDAASRAYGKVDTLLPARLRSRGAALRTSIEAEHRPTPDVAADTLGELAEAVQAQEIVAFHYRDRHGDDSRRKVEAHRQVHLDRRWYFFGWDLEREDWRVYRTDRITQPRRTGRRYSPRPLPSESAIAYLRSGRGEHYETARLVIDAALLVVADALRHEDVELEAIESHRTRATLALDAWQRILAPLSDLGADFQIEASPATLSAVRRFARRLVRAAEPLDSVQQHLERTDT